jgi:hypothetical protein
MDRLTKFEKNPNSKFPYKLKDESLCTELDSIHTLGLIEDLMEKYNVEGLEELDKLLTMATSCEELSKQLGCPLNVYMQIEMDRVDGLYDEKGNFWKFDYMTYRHFRCYRKNDKDEEIDKTFDVNGYKKTWWLKKDLSE